MWPDRVLNPGPVAHRRYQLGYAARIHYMTVNELAWNWAVHCQCRLWVLFSDLALFCDNVETGRTPTLAECCAIPYMTFNELLGIALS